MERKRKKGGGDTSCFADRICKYIYYGGGGDACQVCAKYLYFDIKFEERVYQKAKGMKKSGMEFCKHEKKLR